MLNERPPAGKPVLTVDLGGPAPGGLTALSHLSALKAGVSHHEDHDQRHPLGIYNLSVTRVCEKVRRCSVILEEYFLLPPQITEIDKHAELRDGIVDRLELCLYVAAEHIDDVELIGKSFFKDPKQHPKSPHTKALNRAMKPLRDQITSVTNAIKHAQGRLRLFALEVNYDDRDMCLHGFFVEGFEGGAVAPSPVIHKSGGTVFSITSFLWGILLYIELISREIGRFLEAISAVDGSSAAPVGSTHFGDAVIALARLPLYSFDDTHPFERTRLVINHDEEAESKLRSNIYGSAMDRWSKSGEIRFGNRRFMMEGDGVSTRFTFSQPNQLRLQHWT